ncbi:ferritin family protein [Chryseomicrobium palamuruense]|uniref:Ferritin family protein n=1 Tax=Chryseomicrobium palamuruense TaxID=682973 RepID=A0ABV8URI1_9BACL
MNTELENVIRDKYEAYYHYRQLYDHTRDKTLRKSILHIAEDEKAHYEMFQQLYFLLTGDYVKNLKKPEPFSDNRQFLHHALEKELDAADHYKMLVLKAQGSEHVTPFWIAMHDEMEHAIRLQTYLYEFDERS